MPAGQPSVRATSSSTSAAASPSASRPLRNSSASGGVNRNSSARSSSSCPRARRAPSGSAGSVRVESTTCTVAGTCSTNHATLSRAGPLARRWKSSSTSTTSPCSASALTSRGSTTSTSGAVRVGGASSGHARRSASIACDHSTTASLSPSSSVSHATGRSSRCAQAATSVDLPNPAGQATRLSRLPRPSLSRANSRSRAIVCAGTCGACSFVTRRTGASGRLLISSTGTRSQRLPAACSRRYGPAVHVHKRAERMRSSSVALRGK